MSAAELPKDPGMLQWKITWRRKAWGRTTQDQGRSYTRLSSAHDFLAKLLGNGRPELSPIVVRLHVRDVGPWRPIDALPTDPTTSEEQS